MWWHIAVGFGDKSLQTKPPEIDVGENPLQNFAIAKKRPYAASRNAKTGNGLSFLWPRALVDAEPSVLHRLNSGVVCATRK
jgi:hypothetical protein